jgi:hypothetical protein
MTFPLAARLPSTPRTSRAPQAAWLRCPLAASLARIALRSPTALPGSGHPDALACLLGNKWYNYAMNWKKLCDSKGKHVRLRPPVKRFEGGKGGPELEQIDGDWCIDQCTDRGVHLCSTLTPHAIVLPKDHIHHFTSDSRGAAFGLLTLTVQWAIGGDDAWIVDTVRPNSN